jgi:hypothetical protein
MLAEDRDQGELLVIVRVVKAELKRSAVNFGKMDPFAVVVWTDAEGVQWEGSRTRTDYNGHTSPQWEHTCRGQHYSGQGGGDVVEFRVRHMDTPLGHARMLVDDLLGEAAWGTSDLKGGPTAGCVHQLELKLDGEDCGTVTVQGLLYRHERKVCGKSGVFVEGLTKIEPDLFHHPVSRVKVAGGTAPFFNLKLNHDALATSSLPLLKDISQDYYIGKDLAHASDEVTFYEEVLTLSDTSLKGGLGPLMNFFVDYLGVLTCEEEAPPDDKGKKQKPKDLIVMKNLYCGFKKLRMLDIKIGQKTAQAGWQGKSRMAALRGSVVDGVTNSSCEGYRLEGFDGRPPSLKSMDPLLDLGVTGDKKVVRKALRVMLQRMSGAEMLMHFLDIHQDEDNAAKKPEADVNKFLTRCEVAEVSLHEIVTRLASLAVACRQSPIPQKWIGSSVALGYDSGEPPARGASSEAEVRDATIVQLFDWGRSELNTLEKHMALSDKEQHDRATFWSYYVGGIDRLLWEAARAYRHRFGNAEGWATVTFAVFDFDSMTENDFMGTATVPLEPTDEKTISLRHYSGATVTGGFRGVATLTYSVQTRELPEGSRLAAAWRVCVIRAENLPRMDVMQGRSTSDPFCTVTAVSEDGNVRFRQQTSVKVKNLDPEWKEAFDIPVAAKAGELEAALEDVAPEMVEQSVSWLLPPEEHLGYRDEETVRPTTSMSSFLPIGGRRNADSLALNEAKVHEWTERLDQAAKAASASPRVEWQLPGKRSGWRSRYWKSFDRTTNTSFGRFEVEENEYDPLGVCRPCTENATCTCM